MLSRIAAALAVVLALIAISAGGAGAAAAGHNVHTGTMGHTAKTHAPRATAGARSVQLWACGKDPAVPPYGSGEIETGVYEHISNITAVSVCGVQLLPDGRLNASATVTSQAQLFAGTMGTTSPPALPCFGDRPTPHCIAVTTHATVAWRRAVIRHCKRAQLNTHAPPPGVLSDSGAPLLYHRAIDLSADRLRRNWHAAGDDGTRRCIFRREHFAGKFTRRRWVQQQPLQQPHFGLPWSLTLGARTLLSHAQCAMCSPAECLTRRGAGQI